MQGARNCNRFTGQLPGQNPLNKLVHSILNIKKTLVLYTNLHSPPRISILQFPPETFRETGKQKGGEIEEKKGGRGEE